MQAIPLQYIQFIYEYYLYLSFNIPAIFTHHLKNLSVMQHILIESEEYG